jgi:hypothetical protein
MFIRPFDKVALGRIASRCVDGDGVGALTFGRMGTEMFSPENWPAFTKFISSLTVKAAAAAAEGMVGWAGASDGGRRQQQQRSDKPEVEVPAQLSAADSR